MPDKTYHLVMVMENGSNLQSSDLFINDVKAAQEHFKKKCKEEFGSQFSEQDLESALDEGYIELNNIVVMYTEPYNIFGKE